MELRRAEVAQKAEVKGHALATHLHFSLFNCGQQVLDQVESLDEVDSYLDGLPDVRP
jgi:hypothetical protein